MQNSAELTGWFAYLNKDDEVKTNQIANAIARAFGGNPKGQNPQPKQAQDEEEVIDTTDPEFAKNFKGFTYGKPQPPRMPTNQTSTEILFG
jgi:hypothetical protein